MYTTKIKSAENTASLHHPQQITKRGREKETETKNKSKRGRGSEKKRRRKKEAGTEREKEGIRQKAVQAATVKHDHVDPPHTQHHQVPPHRDHHHQ